jgi:dipeptide/tripeptide permease
VQVTNWSGACYLFPLLGAYIADSHWGRYWTIIVFSIIYILVSGIPSLAAHRADTFCHLLCQSCVRDCARVVLCDACMLLTFIPHAVQGLIGITLSSGLHQLQGPNAPIDNTAFFIGSLYILAIGTGGAWRLCYCTVAFDCS